MRFYTTIFALVATVFAQENPFNIPDGGYNNVNAGSPLNLSWKPTTGGTVTLVLRSGDSSNLQAGTEITANAPNNGQFTWNVPSDITRGFTYTVQIIGGDGQINYTPYFTINSDNTQPSSTSVVATGAPTGAGAALPSVPQSLAAAQSSLQGSATSQASASSAMVSSAASSQASSIMSSMASASASSGSAMTASMMSATAGSASATAQATGAAKREVVGQGAVLGGLMAAVGLVL